ncbi:MAG: SMC family ATPase [Chloroflexota bacterium]
MLPVRLQLYNFLAYRAPVKVIFEGINLACLSGPNGAGKSSLLDAITWALWGRARGKSDDDLIHMGQEEMSVVLDFRQDANLYQVLRKRNRAGRGKSTLVLSAWNDDSRRFEPISGDAAIRETQNHITQLLRLDYETFVNSAFLQQGKADSFTITTPARRKEIFADILGLSRWEQYEKQAKDMLREIDDSRRVNQIRIDEIEREEVREPGLYDQLIEATQQVEAAMAARDTAEKSLVEVAGAQAEKQATEANLAVIQRQIEIHKVDLAALATNLTRQYDQLAKYQLVIDSQAEIEANYAKLAEARQSAQEMGDRLIQQRKIETYLNGLNEQLTTERTKLEKQASIYEDRIRKAELAIADGTKLQAELDTINAELDRLEKRKADGEQIQTEQKALIQEKAERRTQNEQLKTEMEDLRKRLDMVESADGALCPICGQSLDAEHVDELVMQYTAEGTSRGDAYRDNEARLKQIVQISTADESTLKRIEKDLKVFDERKKQQGALHERWLAMEAESQQLDLARADLEVVQRVLDGEDYGHELRQQIDDVYQQIATLGYDQETHTEANQTLKTLSAFEAQKRDLDIAVQQLPELESRLQETQAQHERVTARLNTDCAEADLLHPEVKRLETLVQEENFRQSEVNRLRKEEQNELETLRSIRQELNAIDVKRKRKYEILAEQDVLQANFALYEQLREAFSKNGVPAMIIEAAIPELEVATNRLLSRMTDGQMHVRFDTQHENKSGSVRETLDILISDELGTRSYDMFSGGEGFRVNFALRIALSQFLARRAGARLQTLFIDEGFGSQDDIGRERLVEAINLIRNDFDLILIVTHLDDLRDAFPVHIEVRKTRDGSSITIV